MAVAEEKIPLTEWHVFFFFLFVSLNSGFLRQLKENNMLKIFKQFYILKSILLDLCWKKSVNYRFIVNDKLL